MVLSQSAGSKGQLHPCAFFSPPAIKLALEEWHHLLEGAEQPVVVWTDHKNLVYIQVAKRLNSC